MEEKELTNVSFKELIEAIRKCGLAVSDIHLETIAEACGSYLAIFTKEITQGASL
jgi:hypothetical protein